MEFLNQLNLMVLQDLELDDGVEPGKIREHRVVVGKYRCAPPEDCAYLLEKFCEALDSFPLPDDSKNQFCVVKAIYAHLYLVWIHPFGDGNGRTARLLELYILLSGGFPSPAGHLLSNHYNKTRPEYYKRLTAAINSMDEVINFIQYSTQGLVEGLREQINFIKEQQWQVAWLNYVHSIFHDKNSATDVRRRHLVLALSAHKEPVPVSKLTNLTGEIATEYFGKTSRTLVRDLNALVGMGVIERRRGMVKAKREAILAFLPWRSAETVPV